MDQLVHKPSDSKSDSHITMDRLLTLTTRRSHFDSMLLYSEFCMSQKVVAFYCKNCPCLCGCRPEHEDITVFTLKIGSYLHNCTNPKCSGFTLKDFVYVHGYSFMNHLGITLHNGFLFELHNLTNNPERYVQLADILTRE